MEAARINVLERICNILEVVGIIFVLLAASIFQFFFHELPCPLCLLQRIGFFGIAFGFLLNLRFGLRPSHYSIVLLSAIFTSFTALRHIALHIVPGTGFYGSALFGFHLYTWSFIIAMIVIVITTLMSGVDRQYLVGQAFKMRYPWLVHSLFVVLIILLGINLLSVLMQCGFHECPDNPTRYLF